MTAEKNSKKRVSFFLLLLFITPCIQAQIPIYKYSIKSNFSIPTLQGSAAYKKTFSGVIAINPSFVFYSKKGLFAGSGFYYQQNKTANSRNFNIGSLEVKHHILSPNIFVGYQYFDGSPFNIGLEFAYHKSFGRFSKSMLPDTVTQKPSLNQQFNEYALNTYLSFFTDENLSFSLQISYHYQQYSFDPFTYNFNIINKNVVKDDIEKFNQFITFGLGFTYHFGPFKNQPIREN